MKNLWNHLPCDFEDSGVLKSSSFSRVALHRWQETQLGEFHDQIGGASLKETCYPRHGDGKMGGCVYGFGDRGMFVGFEAFVCWELITSENSPK